ncbi:uncharacterized protein NPIL_209131, partial [Nephila pilipes]
MWFQLAFNAYGPALAALVGMNNKLYFRIIDVAQLLGKKNGYCFAKRFSSDIVLGKDVLPLIRHYPHHTLHARLVTTNIVFRILQAENVELAGKFCHALKAGFADVVGRQKFSDSYKKADKLILVDIPKENSVSVPVWIHEFIQNVQSFRELFIPSQTHPVSNEPVREGPSTF